MNQEFKAKWCEALRSGKYIQGQERLRGLTGRWCCLGVARELLEPGSNEMGEVGVNSSPELLSRRFLQQSGLSNDEQIMLAGMNDDGKSFPEIADEIERVL